MITITDIKSITIPQQDIATFCRRHHIQKLAFFGSVLRADFGPDSDIDVLVEFEPDVRLGLMTFAKIQRELADLLQRPVDLVTPEGLKPLLKETVLESAQVIYAV